MAIGATSSQTRSEALKRVLVVPLAALAVQFVADGVKALIAA